MTKRLCVKVGLFDVKQSPASQLTSVLELIYYTVDCLP